MVNNVNNVTFRSVNLWLMRVYCEPNSVSVTSFLLNCAHFVSLSFLLVDPALVEEFNAVFVSLAFLSMIGTVLAMINTVLVPFPVRLETRN